MIVRHCAEIVMSRYRILTRAVNRLLAISNGTSDECSILSHLPSDLLNIIYSHITLYAMSRLLSQ